MRIAWAPFLLGLAATVGGLALLGHGWTTALAGAEPAQGAASLAAGALLTLLGLLMVVVPLLVPLLYRIYGEDAFRARAGGCPVVAKCPRCSEFTFRGKDACKACGADLRSAAEAPAEPPAEAPAS